jgi:hypothetical protein
VTIEDDLSLRSSRQVEAVDERVSRVSLARIFVAVARVRVTITPISSLCVWR